MKRPVSFFLTPAVSFLYKINKSKVYIPGFGGFVGLGLVGGLGLGLGGFGLG